MTKRQPSSFLSLSKLVTTHSLRAMGHAVAWSVGLPFTFLQSKPHALTLSPQDIRTADATIAEDIYSGYFSFTGKVVALNGQSPFHVEPPSLEWARQLHSFRWLRHLRAADTALSKLNARALVEDWLNASPREQAIAWEPEIASRRLIAWLSQSPIILEGADSAFYRRFLQALGRHIRFLKRCLNGAMCGYPRLICLIALTDAALCAEGLDRLQKSASRALIRELNLQILRDGGHISRNPQMLIDLALDLLPLRQLFVARGLAPSAELQNVLDRMMPMLRMFRHTNGALALFNGMGVTSPELLATLFAYDEAQVAPILNADMSGYQRLEAEQSVLIVDTGLAPPSGYNDEAHAAALAFEFSHLGHKIFTNCGSAERHRPNMREAGRLTAAHNAVTLDDVSSAQQVSGFWAKYLGPQLINGPKNIALKSSPAGAALEIDASHDGYRTSHQAWVRRCLTLSQDGLTLGGVEELLPIKPDAAAEAQLKLRFHLEPATKIQQFEDRTMVALTLADGNIWHFACDSHTIEVEDSILFADPSGPKRTKQLLVSTTDRRIEWVVQLTN